MSSRVAVAVLAAAVSAQGSDDRHPFVNKDGKLGFIDSTGREVITAQFQSIADMSHFNDGLAPVNGPEGSGYIDPSGRFVIGPTKEWGQARPFSEGIAAVLIWAKTRESYNTPAFIDRTGRVVLSDSRVKESSYFSEWTKGGFVDRHGKTIIPPRYDGVWGFSNGAALVRLNGLFGYVDRGGQEIIRAQFSYASYLRRSPAERPKCNTIVKDQGFFLFAAPPFQLVLARDRDCNRGVLLGENHAYGPPGCRVHSAASIIVFLFARREVLGVADVQRVVNAAEDVREGHSTTMPSSSMTKQDEPVVMGPAGPSMRQRPAFGWPPAYSGHSICMMACHEGAFGLPQAG